MNAFGWFVCLILTAFLGSVSHAYALDYVYEWYAVGLMGWTDLPTIFFFGVSQFLSIAFVGKASEYGMMRLKDDSYSGISGVVKFGLVVIVASWMMVGTAWIGTFFF
jgi:hypothetical protein